MKNEYKKIWMRAGLDLLASDEEAAIILGEDDERSKAVVTGLIKEGRFQFDGNSYIPACVIADYDKSHGTGFDDDKEPEFEFPVIAGFHRLESADPRFIEAAIHASKLTPKDFIKCQGCLRDNGIEADETATVLQALCYMLLGIETDDMLNWGQSNCSDGQNQTTPRFD